MRLLTNGHGPAPGERLSGEPGRLTHVKGVPQVIALQYPTGKAVTSPRSGRLDMMYTLVDGRKAFFPVYVAEAISDLHLDPREPFRIVTYGPDKWGVERIDHQDDGQEYGAERHQANYTAPAPTHSRGSYSHEHSAAPASSNKTGKMNGQGEDVAAILARCFDAAIAIAAEKQEQARAKGLIVTVSFEDLRTMAATMLITESGGRK